MGIRSGVTPVIAVLFATLVGCEDKPDDQFKAFVERRAQSLCEINFRCCSDELLAAPNVEACRDHGTWPYESAVSADTTTIDYAQAEKCFDAVDEMTCEQWQAALEGQTPSACLGIISGRNDGESCDSPYECTSGHCLKFNPDAPALYDASATGKCAPLGAEGDPCILQVYSCELGLGCRGTRDAATCRPYPMGGEDGCEGGLDCRAGVCNSGECPKLCYGHPAHPTILGETW